MTEETKNTGLQSLWDKKFPQYIGTYFAVGFGALQFLEFLSKRYDLSENFVDKYMLVWFALLPALLILIYFRGKLNPTTSTGVLKWPKFAVIGNLVIAFLLGTLLPIGEAKAEEASEIVQLTDEEGKEIKAVVPALHKVKTVACFQFENLTGDTKQEWWSNAFSYLLMLDLDQRPEYYALSQFQLHRHYDGLGLEGFILPNVGMQREIAQKSRSDYFTNISFTIKDKKFIFKGNLYSSRDGKSIIALETSNVDPYLAIDDIKQQIFDNIPDPFDELKNEIQLPVSALVSTNKEALKNIILARTEEAKNPTTGLQEVVRLAKKAVDIDPTCSVCSLKLGNTLFALGRKDEAAIHIKSAIKYGASLPERMQFSAKETLYSLNNNIDAVIKLQEVRRKMFPYDFYPYQALLPFYIMNYGLDSTKTLLREAIDNGNVEKGLLTLYNIQVQSEDYLEAEKTLNQFSKAFPDREQDRMRYADIYEKQGKIEQAKEIMLEEETLDPLNASIQDKLAKLDFKNADIVEATKRIDQALQQATSLSDSLTFLLTKGYFMRMMGQIDESIQIVQEYEKQGSRQIPVISILVSTFTLKSDLYQSKGNSERVEEIVKGIEKYAPEAVPIYNCLATSNLIERNYSDVPKDQYISCREQYQTLGDGFGEYYDLLIAYKAKDYDKCLQILEQDNDKLKIILDPKRYFLVDIYIAAGKIDVAKKLLQKTIDQKNEDPIFRYKLAALLENENKKMAKEHLNVALKYWANADEDYIPLQRAKVLAERLAIYNADKS